MLSEIILLSHKNYLPFCIPLLKADLAHVLSYKQIYPPRKAKGICWIFFDALTRRRVVEDLVLSTVKIDKLVNVKDRRIPFFIFLAATDLGGLQEG
jgi:hypothetical protein